MNEIRELTEMEVEAVSGGSSLSSLLPSITVDPQIITQLNLPTQVAVSAFGNAGNLIGGLTNVGSQSH